MVKLSEEEWAEIDALIFSRRIIPTLRRLRERTGIPLKEAMEVFDQRYRQLRRERPGDFTCTDAEYWVGVYS